MPKFVVPRSDAVHTLSRELGVMSALSSSADVNLNELAKALAVVVGATRAVFIAADLPSVRMDAAVKALDLRSKKSELEAFVRGSA